MIPDQDHSHGLMTRPRGDRLVALFLFGAVAFSPPLLQVFGVPVTLFGLPLIYVYLFVGWAVLIGLVAWYVEGGKVPKRPDGERP